MTFAQHILLESKYLLGLFFYLGFYRLYVKRKVSLLKIAMNQ